MDIQYIHMAADHIYRKITQLSKNLNVYVGYKFISDSEIYAQEAD